MNAVRVLLVYPGSLFGGSWAAGPRVKPELLSTFGYVRRLGHHVDVLDLETELGNPAAGEVAAHLARVEELLAGRDADLVEIDCRTSLQYSATVAVAERVRRLYPEAVISVTGHHVAARPDEFAYEGAPFNWLLVGDPETAVAQVAAVVGDGDRDVGSCRGLEGSPLQLTAAEAPDFAADPYMAPGLSELGVYLSRGCPYHTAACMLRPGGHGWMAFAPPVALGVLDAMAALEPAQIRVLDPAFGFDNAWRGAMLDKLAETYRRAIPLTIRSRPEALSRRDLDRVYRGSLRLELGVETLSRTLLQRTGAAPNPQRAVAQALDLMIYASAKGIPTTVRLAFNQPGETRETATETLDLLEEFTAGQPNTSLVLTADSWAYFPTSESEADVQAPSGRFGTQFAHDGWWREPIASEPAAKAVVASRELADLPPGDDSYWRPRFVALRDALAGKLTAEARHGLRSHESVGSAATDVPHGWWIEGRWH